MVNKNVIRFEFTKKEGLKYISHLDLQRAVARIIKRSGIPIRYTEGFNPHPKMVFGLPLSVGCESECELLDVYMIFDEKRPGEPLYTPEEFKRDIVPNLPVGLDFVTAFYPEKSFSDIKSAKYKVSIELNGTSNICEDIKNALNSPMVVTKKTKAGPKEVDISPLIFDYSIELQDKNLFLKLELSAAQNEFLNPEYVMTGLKNDDRISSKIEYYTVMRKAIVFK